MRLAPRPCWGMRVGRCLHDRDTVPLPFSPRDQHATVKYSREPVVSKAVPSVPTSAASCKIPHESKAHISVSAADLIRLCLPRTLGCSPSDVMIDL